MSKRFYYSPTERLALAKYNGYLVTDHRSEEDIKNEYFMHCEELGIPYILVLPRNKFASIEVDLVTARFLTDEECEKIHNLTLAMLEGEKKLDMVRKNGIFTAVNPYAISLGDFRGARCAGEHAKSLFKTLLRMLDIKWERPPYPLDY